MQTIPLVNSDLVALVDDADYDYLSQFRWYLLRGSERLHYAYRFGRDRKSILMHREILQPGPREFTDHIDHDGLNNQRANLRVCTKSENQQNARKYRNAKQSIYKGVNWVSRSRRWQATIKIQNQRLFLGYFFTQWEAAMAYNAAATTHFGEFACLNDIPSDPTLDDQPVPHRQKSSLYRGVSWNKREQKWYAYVDHKKHHTHLGLFDTEEAAARARDAAALQIQGPQVRLNFPD